MWSLRRWRSARPLLTLWGWAERACLESESRALSALSTADKGNGPRQTLSITWLQMERIISSKGQKCSLVRYWVRLQEVGVSNHLPRRKSEKKRVQSLKNRLYKKRTAETHLRTFMGFCPCSRTVAITRFLTCRIFIGSFSLAQWIPLHCSTIWTASALIRRPAAGLLAWAFLSTTLVKLLNLFVHPYLA